jgi:hypothetical protein
MQGAMAMARLTDQERAARQALKVEQERAKLAQLNARISARERKLDTQRKIIIGGMVLAEARDNPAFAAQIARLIRERVTRPQDRNALGEMFAEPANSNQRQAG